VYALVLVALAACSWLSAPAEARAWECARRSGLSGPCFLLRGRMQPYNGGSPNIRIWPVGTTRLLGVEQDANETVNIPPGLEHWLEFGTLIFADFTVCPLTEDKPGYMRIVCVESAQNIRVEHYPAGGGRPEVTYPGPVARVAEQAAPHDPGHVAIPIDRTSGRPSGPGM
jgi:hypothetical protein